MNKIIIITEENNKIIYTIDGDNTNTKYCIKNFVLEEDIQSLVINKNRLFIFLASNDVIVLPDPNILDNVILKDLKKKVEIKLFKFICKLGLKKVKKILEKIKIEYKVLTASSLAALIAFISCPINISAETNTKTEDSNLNSYMTTISGTINITEQDKPIKFSKVEPNRTRLKCISYSLEDEIIKKYSNMYFIDYEVAYKYINENMDKVNQYNSYELGVLSCLKDYHWEDDTINKTPMISSLLEEEKEKFILEMANVYGITDEETLSVMLAVHRLETFYGTSNVYLNLNNCGGVMIYDDDIKDMVYIEYKTFEIGAESFVRNFLNIKNRVLESIENNEPGFNANWSLAKNMDSVYCGFKVPAGQQSWHEVAEEIMEKIKDSGILNDYIKDPNKIKRKV